MQTLTVSLSETDFRRLQHAAKIAGKPVGEIAALGLRESLPPLLEVIPRQFRADLRAMESLPDDDLWEISRRVVEERDARRFRRLQKKDRIDPLTDRERQSLSELRVIVDRVMFQKAYALLLLKWRGFRVPTLSELENRA